MRRLLPWLSDEKETESMPGRLPSMQRQHQSPLWKLWSLRLLRDGGGVLQRDMYLAEFGSAQLRSLRTRLPGVDTRLRPRNV
jgi:hypothetical protein